MIRIVSGSDARQRILEGIELACRAVRLSMGPHGRAVVSDRLYGAPILHDGVGIVRAIELADPFANIGVKFLREVVVGTSDAVGDGTSTAAVLYHALVRNGARRIAAGADARRFCAGIAQGAALAAARLRAAAVVAGAADLAGIAAAAAHGDAAVGAIVVAALRAAGPDGLISVVPGRTHDTRMEAQQGFSAAVRPLTPLVERVEQPLVLVVKGEIASFDALCPVLEMVLPEERPLLVFADEVADEVKAGIARNRTDETIEVIALAVTGTSGETAAAREDIAALCGACVVDAQAAITLEMVTRDMIGAARSAVLHPARIVVYEGADAARAIAARRRAVAALLASETRESERDAARACLARLAGRGVVIEVGGITELDMAERRDRIDNAVRAGRSAATGGVVAGGGTSLVRAAGAVRRARTACADRRAGLRVLADALEMPARAIIANGGAEPGPEIARMRERGAACPVLDPVEVLVSALSHAAPAACLLLAADVAMAEAGEQ